MKKMKLSSIILAFSLVLSGVSAATLAVETSSDSKKVDAAVGTYYSSISSTDTGDSLKNKLHSLNESKRTTTVGYDGMRYLFKDVDTYSGANGKIVGFYDNALVGPDWDKGATWNREHVWPDSRGGNKVESDMHMIRPAKVSSNSDRGNLAYAASGAFDPGYDTPEYRGIAARIIFYSAIADTSLTLTDNTTFGSSQMGKLSDLLTWNKQYAPNTTSSASVALKVEQNRNEVISSASKYGGNRNPFIDHPEYACRIWGETNSATRAACSGSEASVITGGDTLTDIDMSETSITLSAGETHQLTVIPTPSTASNAVTWTSSNQNVATVSSSGLITISSNASVGAYTLITATSTVDSNLKAYCNVTVIEGGSGSGGGTGEDTPVGEYTLAGSYDFSTTKSTDAISTSTNISGFKISGDTTATINEVNKGNLGFDKYLNLGLKFGTSSVAGNITFKLSQAIDKFTMNVAGWTTSDTITVNNENAVTPGVAYTEANPIKEYSFEFATATDTITIAFSKRGFLQNMSFYKKSGSPKTLSSVAISGTMTKKSYNLNDNWNPSGLIVTGTYSDTSTADLTSSASFTWNPTKANSSSITSVSVTATVEGVTSPSFTINGITITEPTPKTLTSLTFGGDMTKKSYSVGESWDRTGITITGHYSDGSTANVTSQVDWTWNPEKPTEGTTSVEVMVNIDQVLEVETYTGITVTASTQRTYIKVTAEPTSWVGDYLIVHEASNTAAHIFNGLSGSEKFDEGTISSSKISDNNFTYVSIAEMTGGYSIQIKGTNNNGKYLKGTSGSNTMNFETDPQLNTISYDTASSSVLITSNTSVLRWNDSTSNGHLFRYYKSASWSGQTAIQLYKFQSSQVAVTGVELDKSTLSINVGGSSTLTATINPSDATNKNITWESSNDGIATVVDGEVTGVGQGTATITVTTEDGGFTDNCVVTVEQPITGTVDSLSQSTTGITGTSYTAFSNKSLAEQSSGITSNAVYAGRCAGSNSSIQLRSDVSDAKPASGVITTSTGGVALKLTITWQSSTAAGRKLDVYGSNTPYTDVSNLVNNETKGDLIGSIVCGTSTELQLNSSGKYLYIGFRSNSGALYISQADIVWDDSPLSFVNSMNNDLHCDSTGITPPSKTEWANMASAWANVSSDGKEILKSLSGNEEGTNIERALYKYDYIINKYGTSEYNAFINGRVAPTPIRGFITQTSHNESISISVIGLVIGLTGIGAFFFIRKRKEN